MELQLELVPASRNALTHVAIGNVGGCGLGGLGLCRI